MNIYEFDFGSATDWVIAMSKQEAIEEHSSVTGAYIEEYDRSAIRKLRKAEWNDRTYFNEDMGIPEDEPITFAEFMDQNQPMYAEYFCSTEY